LMFLAIYADVLTDAHLPDIIDRFAAADAGASLLAVPPQSAFHVVQLGEKSRVDQIIEVSTMPLWDNGGYFVLRPEIFDYLPPDCDLLGDLCPELAKPGRLLAYPYRGFWQAAATVEERAALDAACAVGDACTELANRGRLRAYPYRGFCQAADTVQERAAMDAAYAPGTRPWMLWEQGRADPPPRQPEPQQLPALQLTEGRPRRRASG